MSLLLRMLFVLMFWTSVAVGQMVTKDFAIVQNPDHPANGIRRMKMREIWRKGASEEDDPFALVIQAIEYPEGEISVLDYVQCKLFFYGYDGRKIKEWNIRGEGPGEVVQPVNLIRLKGDTLALVQMFPGKIEYWAPTGDYIRTFRVLDPNTRDFRRDFFYEMVPLGQNIVIAGESMDFLSIDHSLHRENYVSVFDSEGHEVQRLFNVKRKVDWVHPQLDEDQIHNVNFRQIAVRDDGIVFVPTKRNGYEITGFDPKKGEVIKIFRDFKPRKRTAAERRFYKAKFLSELSGSENPKVKASWYDPDVESLRVSDTGDLWVVTSRSHYVAEPGVFARYDVFDRTGKFIRQDEIIIPDEDRSGRLLWLSDDRAILVTGLKDALDGFKMVSSGISESPRELYQEPMEIMLFEVMK